MNTRKFKAGDFARILQDDEWEIERGGSVVKIEKYKQMWAGHPCWYIIHEDGKRGAISEMYLEPYEPYEPYEPIASITLEQVVAAKNVVDKAQKMFVELLSKYQLQEASK